MRRKFWMVWCPTGGAPTHKHFTNEGAEQEAERLARMNPGQVFVVLEALGAVVKRDLAWTALVDEPDTEEDDDLPF